MNERYWLTPRRQFDLLETMMLALSGPETFISIEGDLSRWQLNLVPRTSNEARGALNRQTRYPVLDFAVFPLLPDTCPMLLRQIRDLGFTNGIEHIQIEKEGTLAFAACDGFHPECVFAFEIVSTDLLDTLVKNGVIHCYVKDRTSKQTQ